MGQIPKVDELCHYGAAESDLYDLYDPFDFFDFITPFAFSFVTCSQLNHFATAYFLHIIHYCKFPFSVSHHQQGPAI
jgi:hypothetical protein